MAADAPEPLTPAQLADIDAQYVPFPSFENWSRAVPREDLWDRAHERFKEACGSADATDLAKAQEVALRTAAFDTGAIEGLYPTNRGLTFTVATQAAAWEQEVAESDANALPLFEAQLEAFELILDVATHQFPRITQSLIRRIHEVVTAPQETYVVITPVGAQEQALPKGAYKEQPNHVRGADGAVHAYAPVESTQPEMQRLLDEVDSADFREAHPITQASYVHYALVAVHPFADGNGRVARAVSSAYTYRAASVPLLVLAHHRDLYFEALAKADAGDHHPFIEFISRVGRDALEMVTERLKSASAPQPQEVLARFREIYLAQGTLSHGEMDALANGLVEDVAVLLEEKIGQLALPDGVTIDLARGSGGVQKSPSRFRSVVKPRARFVDVALKAAPPGQAAIQVQLEFFVSTDSDTASSVMVRARDSGEEIVLGLADLSPELSSAARLRLESFLERVLGNGLSSLLHRSRRRLAESGY